MATFTDKFASLIREKRNQFSNTFSEEATTPFEEKLKKQVQTEWHPLPPVQETANYQSYAVDGSQATRTLSNGAFMAICQALLIGPDLEETDVSFDLVRGTPGRQELDRMADLQRQQLELGLALQHIQKISGGVLYIDGTLHGQMRILDRGLLRVEDRKDLPQRVTATYLDLLEKAELFGVKTLGISKTSRECMLAEFLSFENKQQGAVKIPDAEMLYRWAKGPGYTTPLLLGSQDIGQTAEGALRTPESIREDPEQKNNLHNRLKRAPAIVSFHVRLAHGEDTLRIDIPAHWVGLKERIGDLKWRSLDPRIVEPILQILRSSHGGLNVYNAMLYVVDKQVRLHEKTVSGAYLEILRSITGRRIEVDRSKRRFL